MESDSYSANTEYARRVMSEKRPGTSKDVYYHEYAHYALLIKEDRTGRGNNVLEVIADRPGAILDNSPTSERFKSDERGPINDLCFDAGKVVERRLLDLNLIGIVVTRPNHRLVHHGWRPATSEEIEWFNEGRYEECAKKEIVGTASVSA